MLLTHVNYLAEKYAIKIIYFKIRISLATCFQLHTFLFKVIKKENVWERIVR